MWCLSGCYVVKQAYYQNGLINGRREVTSVVADQSTPAEVKAALAQTQEIMDYAQSEGLNTKGAYRYYVDTPEPVVSYLVFAAYQDRLESKTWWFPVVGSVPYLGFFAKADRDAETKKLTAEGLDVHESAASAFSSLGWFEDPLYKPMLLRKKHRDLAHLLFHELTHRTVWVADSVEFNEALAEYVADQMTAAYLTKRGMQSELDEMRLEQKDEKLFKEWLGKLKAALATYYDSKPAQGELMAGRERIFKEYLSAAKLPTFSSLAYKNISTRAWNNATVLGYSLYTPDHERFVRAHRCLGDVPIREFLRKLGEVAVNHESGFAALDSFCSPDQRGKS